jgi:hypothetical protein
MWFATHAALLWRRRDDPAAPRRNSGLGAERDHVRPQQNRGDVPAEIGDFVASGNRQKIHIMGSPASAPDA